MRKLQNLPPNKESEAYNFFERQQSDRKKRTFEILSKFNPILANQVIYKNNFMRTQDRASVKIQKIFKGFMARKRYNQILIKHMTEQEEKRENQERKRVERWMLERETELLQNQIEERNRLFKANMNIRVQAAIVI